MNANQLKEQLTKRIYETAESIISQRAETLKALIKYEIAVMNTELALRSNDHGYDFKFLSDSYANNVVLHPIQTADGSVSLTLTIPQHAYKDASDEEVEFFKTFVLRNAVTKLKRSH